MVDSLTPLPPISPSRVAKSKVTEKNPHHQNEQRHHRKDDEDIEDEIIISGGEPADEKKKPLPHSPLHNIDIEA